MRTGMNRSTNEKKQSTGKHGNDLPPIAHEPAREYAFELLEDRVIKARERLQEVDDEIKRRRRLSYEFLREIDDEIWYFKFHLGQFNKFFGVGYNAGIDARRNQLERLLFATVERKRREELRVWGDISNLRRELQESMKEYESLLRTQKAVEKKK